MKEMFRGFYGISNEELAKLWKDDKTTFVFDTNALLLLYRCESQTREDFFKVWEQIKDKVWLPYHVCLEFQRNRLNAIKTHVTELENFGKDYKDRLSKAAPLDNAEKNIVKRYASLEDEFNIMSEDLNGVIDSFIKDSLNSRISEADFLKNHDVIRDKISDLIGDKIGAIPSAEEVLAIETRGATRYKNKIPPGYMDEKEKKDITYNYNGIQYESKYGDWMIWNEILNFAKNEGIKSVVFVSNDLKEDWVFRIGGRIRGPQEYLKTELFQFSGAENLHLYSSPSFLSAANEYLDGDKASDHSIKEMEGLTKRNIIDKYGVWYYPKKNNISSEIFPSSKYISPPPVELDKSQQILSLKKLLDHAQSRGMELRYKIEKVYESIESQGEHTGTDELDDSILGSLHESLERNNFEINMIIEAIDEIENQQL